ncbi:MAG: HemK/PrmC family methyltransferase [Bacteroidota bacterium]
MNFQYKEVNSIVRLFRDELNGIYPDGEINNFIYMAFEEYLGFSKTDMVTKFANILSKTDLLKMKNVVKQLKLNKPIQYILGTCEFYGLKLKVDQRVMIPRPETEELVDWIINDANKSNLKILDIGTGSGCIAIALKKNIPDAIISSIDVSEKALSLARENAKVNNVSISFFYMDILKQPHPCHSASWLRDKSYAPARSFDEKGSSSVGSPAPLRPSSKVREFQRESTPLPLMKGWWEGLFDIIVSNPPYVRISEKKQMEKNVLDYEPYSALFVEDENPLIYYKIISDIALGKLKKNGKLYFEINEYFGNEIKALLENKRFTQIIVKRDMQNKERMVRGILGKSRN